MNQKIVLCVDDDATVLSALRTLLDNRLGSDVVVELAESAEEAMEICADLQRDGDELAVVITDFIMPNSNGDELLVNLHRVSQHTIKIMLTGQSALEGIKRAINEANLYRFLEKPFDNADMVLTARSALHAYNQDRELARRNAELVDINRSLERLVDERTAELWDKNQELERVSATKSTFLATMSHEIRTPMNGILGMLELLQHTDMTPRQLDYARKAQGAAQSLLGIINAILDISKVEAGKMALECAPFVLRDVLHALRAVLSASQGSKPVELRLDVAPDVPAVLLGDALRLRQVLLNLSGNALKFTARGEVVLSIALLGWQGRLARLEFSVLDTGIGIAPDKLALIFEGFNQADAATARHFGGTGLGLAISKQLVALMGGDLQVQSTPGVGSRFYFQVALEALTDEAGLGIDSQAVAPVHQSWQGTHRLHGLRLLVVDDNRLGQQVAQELLQNCGAQVAIASCGLAAVAQALAADPPLDAILMDLRMPDIDGLEATRRIRSHPHMQAVPIIAMTANAMAADRDACRAAGMADHVSKPIDLDALIRTVLRHARPTAGSGQPSAPLASAPREAPPAQRAVLDVEQAIERMCGDRALYVKVAAAFRVEAMEKLAGFERALAQGQRHDALRCLHTLAGLAGIVGANQLNHAAAQAEAALAASPQFVATGNAPEAAGQLQELATQLRLAIWMLDQLQL